MKIRRTETFIKKHWALILAQRTDFKWAVAICLPILLEAGALKSKTDTMKIKYSFITVPVLIIVLKIIISAFPEQHGTLAEKNGTSKN